MSTRADTITDLTDALAGLPGLRAAKMFGEYGLYLGTKVVAFICDDLLYIKPTPGALALISDPRAARMTRSLSIRRLTGLFMAHSFNRREMETDRLIVPIGRRAATRHLRPSRQPYADRRPCNGRRPASALPRATLR